MSFTNVFGNGPLASSDTSWSAVTIADGLAALRWPFQDIDGPRVTKVLDVTGSFDTDNLRMPPANAVSDGEGTTIANRGFVPFNVINYSGGAVVTVPAGEARLVYVTDNSTEAGVWASIIVGAASSTNDPAALAGYGLAAAGAELQVSSPAVLFSSSDTIDATDRASAYVWTGGVGVLTLPLAATVGSDFLFMARNQGTGTLTLTPSGGETVDASATVILNPSEACAVLSNGVSAWYTFGRGRNQQFNFTLLSKSITGGAVSLTPTEASNVVHRYTGVLTSNSTITLPSVVQVYYVTNATSGAFTVTFRTAGVGATVTVPQGQAAVLFCDGLNVYNSSTTAAGILALTIAQGSLSVPAINFSGDTDTGIYSSGGDTISLVSGAVDRVRATSTGVVTSGTTTLGSGVLTLGSTTAALSAAALNVESDLLILDRVNKRVGTGVPSASHLARLHVVGQGDAATSLAQVNSTKGLFRASTGTTDPALVVVPNQDKDIAIQAVNSASTAKALMLQPFGGSVNIGHSRDDATTAIPARMSINGDGTVVSTGDVNYNLADVSIVNVNFSTTSSTVQGLTFRDESGSCAGVGMATASGTTAALDFFYNSGLSPDVLERGMRLNPSGILIVGTEGATSVPDNVEVYPGGQVFLSSSVGVGHTFMRFRESGTSRGTITQNGASTVAYNTTSDARLKQHITDVGEVGSVVDAVRVREYEFIGEPGVKHVGFIAQELHTVCPQSVSVGGENPNSDPWGVDKGSLTPLIIRELQSLRARVAALEQAALENKNVPT